MKASYPIVSWPRLPLRKGFWGLTWWMAALLASCQPNTINAPSSQPVVLTSHSLPVASLKEATQPVWTKHLRQPQHPLEQATVSVVGLGPVHLGMTLAEAEDATGVAFAIAPGHQARACQYYFPTHDGAVPIESIGLMAINGRLIRIDIWPGSPIQTVSGARIGSTEAELAALYPGQIEAVLKAETGGKYLTYRPNEEGRNLYRIVFETDAEGTVVQYRTGQFPAVTWLEGCS